MPLTFKDTKEYLEIFEPLLFEEVKAQICRGEEEGGNLCFKYFHFFIQLLFYGIDNGYKLDSGSLDWEMAAVIKCEEANDFYFAQVAVQAHMVEQLTDNDIILLSKEKVVFIYIVPIMKSRHLRVI